MPSLLVAARRTAPVAVLVAVTVAPATAAPPASVTTPVISPEVCAAAGRPSAASSSRPSQNGVNALFRIIKLPVLRHAAGGGKGSRSRAAPRHTNQCRRNRKFPPRKVGDEN